MTRDRRFDLIVFDWDGTLFDSTALIARCIQSACVDLGVPAPSDKDASYVIGMGLIDALTHAAPGLPRERYGEMGARYRHHYVNRQHELTLFSGVLELLDDLKRRGHLLGVATGKSRSGLNEALATVALQGLFDATRTADETASKPRPRMLLELMDQLGVSARRTLMIGDTTHDLLLASNAGAASVAVGYGAHEHASFASHGPLFVAHSVPELAQWLDRHG
ncbi:MAG: HAD-IA family hydrolase [Ideonella sp.]